MSLETIETQISSSELEIGMRVVRLDRPWLETDFLVQGFFIQSEEEIESLQRQCYHVFIEGKLAALSSAATKKTASTAKNTKESADKNRRHSPRGKKTTYINKVSIDQEFSSAKKCFTDARALSKVIMGNLRLGRVLDMNQAREFVDNCVDSILRNSNALRWLTQIKNRDEYTAEHSMNVCILSASFARHLGLMEGEIKTVGLCGLLHDVGKSRIPLEILNKPGKLTEDEFSIMRNHAKLGRDILMSVSSSERIAVDVAYSHHERENGSGYPRAVESHLIPYFAKIVSLADIYDAITSNRCYDEGRPSMKALDIIYNSKGDLFDEELANEFIKCIGVYPPGSIVEMSNGEVGIVIRSNPKNKLRPCILMLRDEDKEPYEREHVIDMMKIDLDMRGNTYTIVHELTNGSHGIELRDFLKNGLELNYNETIISVQHQSLTNTASSGTHQPSNP